MSQPVASPRTNPTGRTSPPVRSSVTVILRHRLPPFLGEQFGGCAGLVDVGIDRHPHELVVLPYPDHPAFQLKREVGVMTPVAGLDCVYDPVAQIRDVLDRD